VCGDPLSLLFLSRKESRPRTESKIVEINKFYTVVISRKMERLLWRERERERHHISLDYTDSDWQWSKQAVGCYRLQFSLLFLQ
jgi:hypothetical protein